MTLIGESLTSHVITLTPILAKILTSDPYNCWPLLLRKSVVDVHCVTFSLAIRQNSTKAGMPKERALKTVSLKKLVH